MDTEEIKAWIDMAAQMKKMGMTLEEFQKIFQTNSYKLGNLLQEIFKDE